MNGDNVNIQSFYYEKPNILWCITWKDAYLYKLDLRTKIMSEVVPLSDIPNVSKLFNDILLYEHFFILIPACSDEIVILNRRDWSCDKIKIPFTKRKIGNSEFKFFTGVIYMDCLYIFGYSYPGIVKLDLLTRDVSVIDKWLDSMDLLFNNQSDGCFHMQYYQNDNILYFPFMNANAVLKINLKTEEIVVHKVGNDNQRYISIEWDGNKFWLIPRDGSVGSIVTWNPLNNDIRYCVNYPEGFNYAVYAFYKTVNVGDRMLLFAHTANMNISIDFQTGEMSVLLDLYDTSRIKAAKYSNVKLLDNKILFLNENEIVFWNYKQRKKTSFLYKIDKKICERYENERIEQYFSYFEIGKVLSERENMDIKSYLKYLQK